MYFDRRQKSYYFLLDSLITTGNAMLGRITSISMEILMMLGCTLWNSIIDPMI